MRGGGEPWSRDGPIARSGDRKRAREPRRSHEGDQSRQTHPRDRPEHRGEVVHLVRCALLSALGLRSALRIRLFGCRLLRRGCSLDRRTCVDAGVQPCNGSARVACASQCGTREVREAGKQVDERRNGDESSAWRRQRIAPGVSRIRDMMRQSDISAHKSWNSSSATLRARRYFTWPGPVPRALHLAPPNACSRHEPGCPKHVSLSAAAASSAASTSRRLP